jgi:hypothetical protein
MLGKPHLDLPGLDADADALLWPEPNPNPSSSSAPEAASGAKRDGSTTDGTTRAR